MYTYTHTNTLRHVLLWSQTSGNRSRLEREPQSELTMGCVNDALFDSFGLLNATQVSKQVRIRRGNAGRAVSMLPSLKTEQNGKRKRVGKISITLLEDEGNPRFHYNNTTIAQSTHLPPPTRETLGVQPHLDKVNVLECLHQKSWSQSKKKIWS